MADTVVVTGNDDDKSGAEDSGATAAVVEAAATAAAAEVTAAGAVEDAAEATGTAEAAAETAEAAAFVAESAISEAFDAKLELARHAENDEAAHYELRAMIEALQAEVAELKNPPAIETPVLEVAPPPESTEEESHSWLERFLLQRR